MHRYRAPPATARPRLAVAPERAWKCWKYLVARESCFGRGRKVSVTVELYEAPIAANAAVTRAGRTTGDRSRDAKTEGNVADRY